MVPTENPDKMSSGKVSYHLKRADECDAHLEPVCFLPHLDALLTTGLFEKDKYLLIINEKKWPDFMICLRQNYKMPKISPTQRV